MIAGWHDGVEVPRPVHVGIEQGGVDVVLTDPGPDDDELAVRGQTGHDLLDDPVELLLTLHLGLLVGDGGNVVQDDQIRPRSVDLVADPQRLDRRVLLSRLDAGT